MLVKSSPRRARLQVAAMNPEPDDHRRIRKHDRVHDSRRCVAPQRRRPPPDRRRTPERNDLIHTFHATNRRLESAEERLRSTFPLVSSQSTEDPRNERRTYPPRRCGDPDGASRIDGPSGTSGDGVPTSARGDAVQRRARRGRRCAGETRTWGTSLSRSDREPAVGPACGRGMPSNTPLQGGTKDPPCAASNSGIGLALATLRTAGGPVEDTIGSIQPSVAGDTHALSQTRTTAGRPPPRLARWSSGREGGAACMTSPRHGCC